MLVVVSRSPDMVQRGVLKCDVGTLVHKIILDGTLKTLKNNRMFVLTYH